MNLDSVESVSIAILVSPLGRLRDTRMREICAALAVACRLFRRIQALDILQGATAERVQLRAVGVEAVTGREDPAEGA